MRHDPPASLATPFSVDQRLVSSVQRLAGRRVHEAANLLSAYTLWAEVHRRALADRDVATVRSSVEILLKAERDLRKFLYECRCEQYPNRDMLPRRGADAFDLDGARYACLA